MEHIPTGLVQGSLPRKGNTDSSGVVMAAILGLTVGGFAAWQKTNLPDKNPVTAVTRPLMRSQNPTTPKHSDDSTDTVVEQIEKP